MSINEEINRIENNIADAYDAAEEAGAEMPELRNSANLASTISTVSGGTGGNPIIDNDRPTEDTVAKYIGQEYKTSFGETWICDSINTVSINGTITGNPKVLNGILSEAKDNTTYLINTNTTIDASYTSYELLTRVYVYPKNTFAHNETIFSATSGTVVVYLATGSNKPTLYNGSYYTGVAELVSDKWYWMKVVYNGTDTILYSLLDEDYNFDTLPTEATNWTIQTTAAGVNFYSGKTIRIRDTGQIGYLPIDMKCTQIKTNNEVIYLGTAPLETPTYSWSQVGNLFNKTNFASSISVGQNSKVSNAIETTALGYATNANGLRSVAIGSNANSSGTGGVAIGYFAKANGTNAVGLLGQSTAAGAIALGYGTNSEANTLKVALTSTTTRATDESNGLYTLLKSDGKIPFARVTDIDQLHDHFAFRRNSMTVYSQSHTLDGETWEEDTKDLNKLFIQKDTGTDTTILNLNEVGYTFTLTSTQFRYSEIECFEIATAWVNPASTFTLKIEKSVDNETWDTIVEKTELREQKMYYMPTSSKVSGETAYIRFTFTKTSNLDTGTVKLLTLRALTNRISGQGLARDYSYPFSWDVNNTLIPLNNGSLGTSSNKWTNLYVKNLYPDSFSPSSIKINNRPTTGLYYYNFQVSNMNNYPYHRIAKVLEVDATKQWLDACAFVDIYGNYNGGWFGRIKLSFRTDTKTTSPFGKVEAKWIERYGFAEDSVEIGLYTITDGDNSKAYADIFLKANSTYQCFQLKVVKGSRSALTDDRSEGTAIIFNDTSESNNDTTITECYSDIQGTTAGTAAHDLHNDVQYTSITSSIDSTAVKEAKQIYVRDLTNETLSIDTLFSKTVGDTLCYKVTDYTKSANITDKPYTNDMFSLESKTLRYVNSVRCILQRYISGAYKKVLIRWGTGDSTNAPDGLTWSDWEEEATTQQAPEKEGTYLSTVTVTDGVATTSYKKDLSENSVYKLTTSEKETLLEKGIFNNSTVKNGQLFETEDGNILTFKDQINPTGFTTTYTSLGLRQWWRDIAYGDGVFVAVSQGDADSNPTNIVIYSYDGINWKQTTIPFANKLGNVTYCKDRFICVSRLRDYTYPTNDNRGIYSYDGITWQIFSLPSDSAWYDAAYGNGKFVAIGYNCCATSTDGINWTSVTTGLPSDGWNYIDFIDGKFVASGYHNFSTSIDGVNWTNNTNSNIYFKNCVHAFGNYYTVTSSYMYSSSDDGATWSQVTAVPNKPWQVINFADGVLTAICYDHIYYSTDGTTFGDQLVDYFRWYDLIPVNGRYYSAIGDVTRGAVIDYVGTHTYSLEEYKVLKNTATNADSLAIGGITTTGEKNTYVGITSNVKSDQKGNVAIGSGVTASSSWSVAIGQVAKAQASTVVAIGSGATASGLRNVSIGGDAKNSGDGAVLLGPKATNTEAQTFKVSLNTTNTTATDESGGLYTVLNSSGKIPGSRMSLQDTSAPTTSTVGSVGQFYIDTTNQDAYICVKADTITPEYIWKKITA